MPNNHGGLLHGVVGVGSRSKVEMRTSSKDLHDRCPECGEPFALITHEIPYFGSTIEQHVIECTGNRSHELTPKLVDRVQRMNRRT